MRIDFEGASGCPNGQTVSRAEPERRGSGRGRDVGGGD